MTGVLAVADPLADERNPAAAASEFEARAVSLLTAAMPAMPKELARLMAQYARPLASVTTIAGTALQAGSMDGRALGEALLHGPICLALDESDAVAGPRLLIGEYSGQAIRCLTLRTGLVTTVAGRPETEQEDSFATILWSYADGPASAARFSSIFGMAVAPDGAMFVTDQLGNAVRHISPAPTAGSGPAAVAERMVTTLIGPPVEAPHNVKRIEYSRLSAECFRQPLDRPHALEGPWAIVSVADAADGKERRSPASDTTGQGRLFVGCRFGVHMFDLTSGERRFVLPHSTVSGLAVSGDGARLFVVTQWAVHVMDTRTGEATELVGQSDGRFRVGGATTKPGTFQFGFLSGCVVDGATQSLLMVDSQLHRIVWLRGVAV